RSPDADERVRQPVRLSEGAAFRLENQWNPCQEDVTTNKGRKAAFRSSGPVTGPQGNLPIP
ncbi:MAG: hypothetical protein WA895_10325, partial [Streptosporangiaceae bacterium]